MTYRTSLPLHPTEGNGPKKKSKVEKLAARWQRKANRGEMGHGEMTSKKDIRRTKRATAKTQKAIGTKREASVKKKYGYDMKTAKAEGMKPNAAGHMGSNAPSSGKVLKGKKHPTAYKARKVDRALGYKYKKIDGARYIVKKKKFKK